MKTQVSLALAWLALLHTGCSAARGPAGPPATMKTPPSATTAEAPLGPRVVHRVQGLFGPILVVDEGKYRYLRFGAPSDDQQSMDDLDDHQSIIDLSDAHAVPMEYIRYMALALVYRPAPPRTLMIGLGAGTFPSLLHRILPRARIDAVEIDPVVVDLARSFFGLQQDPRLVVHVADGAAFVANGCRPTPPRKGEGPSPKVGPRYDLLAIDAYNGKGIPEQLRSHEFFQNVAACLAPGGMVVANLDLDDPDNERPLLAALRRVLPALVCYRTPFDENLVVMARTAAWRPAQVAAQLNTLERMGLPFDVRAMHRHAERCQTRPTIPGSAPTQEAALPGPPSAPKGWSPG